jgi:hypothetical protein
MITWILFGHLMTPEQHQTTTDVQRLGSGKTEVITAISNQPKQRSENQRVWGSSPGRCAVAANQAIAGSFCYPIGRSKYRKLDRNPSGSRTVSPRTMSGVVFARLWPARRSPHSELTCDKFQRWVRQSGGTPIRIAETDRIWASGCRSALPGLSASPQVRGRVKLL